MEDAMHCHLGIVTTKTIGPLLVEASAVKEEAAPALVLRRMRSSIGHPCAARMSTSSGNVGYSGVPFFVRSSSMQAIKEAAMIHLRQQVNLVCRSQELQRA